MLKKSSELLKNTKSSKGKKYKRIICLKKAGFPQLINKFDKFIISQGELRVWYFLMLVDMKHPIQKMWI